MLKQNPNRNFSKTQDIKNIRTIELSWIAAVFCITIYTVYIVKNKNIQHYVGSSSVDVSSVREHALINKCDVL